MPSPSAFRRWRPGPACGLWHWVHFPDFKAVWTLERFIPIFSFGWQEKQRSFPSFFSSIFGTMPCRRWQSSHFPSFTAACTDFIDRNFSENFLWQSRHPFRSNFLCAQEASRETKDIAPHTRRNAPRTTQIRFEGTIFIFAPMMPLDDYGLAAPSPGGTKIFSI